MKTIFIDVMLCGRFQFTLKYKFCPLFPIRVEEIQSLVETKRPYLKGLPYNLQFDI